MTENVPPFPQLTVVALATTLRELRRQRDAARDADMVELRLDRLAPGELDVPGSLEGRRTPVIVTCRARWEGGEFQGTEEERARILARALDLGAEYVDVEWRAGFTDLLRPAHLHRVVLSSHDFDGIPGDLTGRARAMRATGAAVVKLAVMTARLRDCLPVLDAARALDAPGRAVFIAMGACGEVSRVCAARFGSAWTYAGSVEGIGQIGPRALLDQYRFRTLTADTPIYGIVGRPIAHSVSPAMHNAAFGWAGVDGVYLALPAVDADDFLTFAQAFGVRGASVTIPYKVALAERMHVLDPLAREVGAINTMRRADGEWQGTNTDVAGFLQPLHDAHVRLAGARVAVAGAGGSARAVVVALRAAGADVTLYARDVHKARTLADAFPGVQVARWPVAAGSWDLLVNCTPVGMHPQTDDSPVAPAALSGRAVYDLIYNPLETRLLREAARAGCATFGGLDMLVAQARDQFCWWTGVRPDAAVMRDAALARLAEFRAHEDHDV